MPKIGSIWSRPNELHILNDLGDQEWWAGEIKMALWRYRTLAKASGMGRNQIGKIYKEFGE